MDQNHGTDGSRRTPNRIPAHWKTGFDVLDVALEFLAAVKPLVKKILPYDADLADELKRAARSTAYNTAESWRRRGKDRTHGFRVANGSAEEARTSLIEAVIYEYIEPAEADEAIALGDRVQRMLSRLS